MQNRQFYLALYDISNSGRLAATLALIRAHACGGQKSVYEIYLSDSEKRDLLSTLSFILEPEEDRFLLLKLDQKAKIHTLGTAVEPVDNSFFYIG